MYLHVCMFIYVCMCVCVCVCVRVCIQRKGERERERGLQQVGSTGWRRLIGSPKLQIIFHQRATTYRALLRKMTYKDKGSYESSPPCRIANKGAYVYAHVYVRISVWYKNLHISAYLQIYIFLRVRAHVCVSVSV